MFKVEINWFVFIILVLTLLTGVGIGILTAMEV